MQVQALSSSCRAGLTIAETGERPLPQEISVALERRPTCSRLYLRFLADPFELGPHMLVEVGCPQVLGSLR